MSTTDTSMISKTKASISSKMLIDAHTWLVQDGHADANGYPDVMNRQSFVDAFITFCDRIAKRKGLKTSPDQVWLNIVEAPDVHDSNPRYAIVIESEERLQNLPRTYSIIMVYKPTNEAESVSLVSDDEIVWSADNQMNTSHSNRTLYYLGFVSLIAEKTPGFDKEPEPENELNVTDFLSEVSGLPPQELIKIPTTPSKHTEEEQQAESITNAQESHAGEWHNGKTKEQENAEETAIFDDLETTFVENEDEVLNLL